MTDTSVKSAQDIRNLRALHSQMRERDFARIHGISEAQLVAAEVGRTAVRIRADVEALLNGLTGVGEVMALTRNESAVHEKIGAYENVSVNSHASIVLGTQIDLRIFPSRWVHAYAVEKSAEDGSVKRSFQVFDRAGNAVHKVHARPATDVAAWTALVETLRHDDQIDALEVTPYEKVLPAGEASSVEDLRDAWAGMTDTHQFFGLLKKLNFQRLDALEAVGEDFAWQLDHAAAEGMFRKVAGTDLPIMAFVGNEGCIQIHSGPITNVSPMGPWLNVMDETFHLHLRLDHVAAAWAVRKPTKDGQVTSVELYDENRELIIQFFGKRHEGEEERHEWRAAVEQLPLLSTPNAA